MKRSYGILMAVVFVVLGAVFFLQSSVLRQSISSADISSAITQNSASISANAGISGAAATSVVSSTPAAATNFLQTGFAPPPKLNDEGSLVADLATGAVFESVNADKRWPTASITKLMTATLVFDTIPTSTDITVTPAMFAVDPRDETTLVTGGTYSAEDLLHMMLMPSSNVAAQAFADTYGLPKFMDAMNARAEAWGMTETYFEDPSGLSAADQSTPDDLLKLAQHIYAEYPGIFAITDTPDTAITNLTTGQKVPVASINDFAGTPDFVGGKTGNTPEAGDNLLSVFMYNGHPFIIVVLGGNTLFGDSKELYNWFRANYK